MQTFIQQRSYLSDQQHMSSPLSLFAKVQPGESESGLGVTDSTELCLQSVKSGQLTAVSVWPGPNTH